MSCCRGCAGAGLIFINIVILFLGGIVAAAVAVNLFAPDILAKWIDTDLEAAIGDLIPETCNPVIDFTEIPTLFYFGLSLIGLASLCCLWALFGLCSACCKSKCGFVTYVVLVSLFVVCLPIGLLLIYLPLSEEVIDTKLKNQISKTYSAHYFSENLLEAKCTSVTLFWDWLQRGAKCCGVDANNSMVTPACTDRYDTTVVYTEGCWTAISEFIRGDFLLVAGISIGVICLLHLFAIIFAIVLLGLGRRTKDTGGLISDKEMMDTYYAPNNRH